MRGDGRLEAPATVRDCGSLRFSPRPVQRLDARRSHDRLRAEMMRCVLDVERVEFVARLVDEAAQVGDLVPQRFDFTVHTVFAPLRYALARRRMHALDQLT